MLFNLRTGDLVVLVCGLCIALLIMLVGRIALDISRSEACSDEDLRALVKEEDLNLVDEEGADHA